MYRTVIISSYDAYLESEYPASSSNASQEERAAEDEQRNVRLSRFLYPVMLELSFPELDFANRWCWENIGAADGECNQSSSEYPACTLWSPHSHGGQWMRYWFVKTHYNFGFNEWYFAVRSHRDRFWDRVPSFNWGEHYPKTIS